MRKLTAVVFASALVLPITAQAEGATTLDEMHQDGGLTTGSMTQNPQSHMFDGIQLTEQQRQQMRDLMQQARHERLPVSIDDYESMHDLVIADQFNETAIRAQAEKMAQAEVMRQIEMARVRNQMYHLLTSSQQAVLERNHQQRMEQLRKLASMQRDSSLQQASSTSHTP